MIPYLIPIAICIYGVFFFDLKNITDSRSKIVWFLLFVYLTLLIGLRNQIGGDSLIYEQFFYDYYDITSWRFNLLDFYQPGFTFIVSLSKYIYPEFLSFQIIHALIINIFLFLFIQNNTRYRYTALLLILYALYLYFMTEILREVLAVIVFVTIFPSYRDRKWLRYFFGVCFACLFHFSALVLLILPFLRQLKLNKIYLFFIGGAIIVAPIALKLLADFNVDGISERAASAGANSSIGMSLTIACFMKGAVFPLSFAYFVKFKTSHHLAFENIIAITGLFGVLSIGSPLLFGRSLNYFLLFLMISFADYLHAAYRCKSGVSISNANIFILFFLVTYLTSYLVIGGWYKHWIPYKSLIY